MIVMKMSEIYSMRSVGHRLRLTDGDGDNNWRQFPQSTPSDRALLNGKRGANQFTK